MVSRGRTVKGVGLLNQVSSDALVQISARADDPLARSFKPHMPAVVAVTAKNERPGRVSVAVYGYIIYPMV